MARNNRTQQKPTPTTPESTPDAPVVEEVVSGEVDTIVEETTAPTPEVVSGEVTTVEELTERNVEPTVVKRLRKFVELNNINLPTNDEQRTDAAYALYEAYRGIGVLSTEQAGVALRGFLALIKAHRKSEFAERNVFRYIPYLKVGQKDMVGCTIFWSAMVNVSDAPSNVNIKDIINQKELAASVPSAVAEKFNAVFMQ